MDITVKKLNNKYLQMLWYKVKIICSLHVLFLSKIIELFFQGLVPAKYDHVPKNKI